MVNVYNIFTDLLPKEVVRNLQCTNTSTFKRTIFLVGV